MAKAIHSMIRVLDEARSVAFYRKAFGLEVADRLDFDDFTLLYLSNGETGFELELTVNNAPAELVLAAPGTVTQLEPNRWQVVHTNGRDFALSLSPYFRIATNTTAAF